MSASESVPAGGGLRQDALGLRLVRRQKPLLDRNERVAEPDRTGHRPVEPVAQQLRWSRSVVAGRSPKSSDRAS